MTDPVKERDTDLEETPERLSTRDMAHALQRPEPAQPPAPQNAPLMPEERAREFHVRWNDIQTSFVDEPKKSVEQADSLVAELMQYLAQTFADEREGLENQWSKGNDVSTEDLRIALQRYRSFFTRLLAV